MKTHKPLLTAAILLVSLFTFGQCPQVADFSFTTSGLTANFTDLSTGITSGTSYYWGFGDGNSSSTTSPSHTYASSGTYQVCLSLMEYDSVTQNYCYDSICQSVTVQGTSGNPCNLNANFNYSVSGQTVSFTNTSTGTFPGMSYDWQFGDGGNSNQENPVYTYPSTGQYVACMTVWGTDSTGNTCIDTICNTVFLDTLTGVKEVTGIQGLNVYPNPVQNMATIEFSSMVGTAIEVAIFDITGKQIQNQVEMIAEGENNLSIDCSQFEKGMYLITLVDQDSGKSVTRKFMKN